ncbi:DUF2889 domain-containing protein [Rhodococcus sp. IEGM 1379]|uniref:DUF2889 domain-containing protein n=1 Tax=Rhodococcus sp. IEGM 1379 TaxID=3047086 RepID=UPI0024B7DA5A|nr:DUF2889 domain-containing protein [Rhodococcus sp. IEGM 1379]MDI9914269.1 DUF2889 domain-containing protein [Rhodococcus sp. IEGM 1379]
MLSRSPGVICYETVGAKPTGRIDIRVGETIEIDSMFQDSSTTRGGGRVAVHEYHVTATADVETGTLLTIDADPRVLPYEECPLASLNVGRIIGTPRSALRTVILEQFREQKAALISMTPCVPSPKFRR